MKEVATTPDASNEGFELPAAGEQRRMTINEVFDKLVALYPKCFAREGPRRPRRPCLTAAALLALTATASAETVKVPVEFDHNGRHYRFIANCVLDPVNNPRWTIEDCKQKGVRLQIEHGLQAIGARQDNSADHPMKKMDQDLDKKLKGICRGC